MNESLRGRSISAFMWGSVGSLIKLVIQFAAQILLARILGPEQYGLFAMGVIVISFSAFLSDIGIAYGLIQRKELTDAHVRFVLTWQLVLGVLVAGGIALLAQPLADFFNEPRAAMVFLALAPLCFIQALTAVSLNLLKRAMDFKTIHMANAISYFVGFVCVGIPMALYGHQVWALVVAWTVQTLVNLVLLYGRSRHPLALLIAHPDGRAMTRFGITVLATNVTNWFIGNIDRVVAARMLSSTAVGLYATAYNLMNTPTQTLLGLLQPVMYSACSKVQGEARRIRSAYLALLGAIAVFIFPVFASLAVISDTFVLALYGGEWAHSAVVLQPIALAMPLLLIWNISTPVLWTNGQISKEFKSQIPIAVAWLVGSLIAVQFSLSALAWTVLVLFVVRSGTMAVAAMRAMEASPREVINAVAPGVLLSLSSAIAVYITDRLLFALDVSSHYRLLLAILAGAVVYLLTLRIVADRIHPELISLIDQTVGKMPDRTSNWVMRLMHRGKYA